MSIEKYVKNICINAKTASKQISCIDENAKNLILESLISELDKNRERIISANNIDVERFKNSENFANSFLDRLLINNDRIDSIIESIKEILDTIKCNKFILISTIDVYDNINGELNEDSNILGNNHIYGRNRYLFEEYIKKKFNNYHIIRLPGLFGKGLKKNIIYDLINNNNVNDINSNSEFQWYYLNWLKEDIDKIINNDIKICNLFTPPLSSKIIINIYNSVFNNKYLINEKDFYCYNTKTKYGELFGGGEYIRNLNDVKDGLFDYFNFEKLDKSKLCVSNICLNNIYHLQFSYILKLNGIKNVQIAPTKLIKSWDKLKEIDFDVFEKNNIKVYSFQSITYTLNNLNIFDKSTQEDLMKHLKNVIDFAEEKGVKVLVFGCPRNKKILDMEADNSRIFIDFFKKIGDYMEGKDIVICIENNSNKYNCNFLNTIDECAELVSKINKNNVKMMVDVGNAIMENDSWYYLKKNINIIYNIDVAHPFMKDFSELHESNEIFNFVLKNNHYKKIINLEMLIKNKENELDLLYKSLDNFIKTYSN
mgnify:CR=1 FL=1